MMQLGEVARGLDAESRRDDRLRHMERVRLLPVILTGSYAWLVAHYPLAAGSGWASPVGLSAAGAALMLVGSPLAPSKRVSLYLVLHGFLATTALTFLLASETALPTVHAGYAALSWLSYTIALGALSTPEPAERPVSEGPPFGPRRRASVVAPVLQLLVCAGVFGLFVQSLGIQRVELRVLSYVVTLALGLLMLSVSVQLGRWFQQRESGLARGSFRRSVWVALLLMGWCALSWVTGWGTS